MSLLLMNKAENRIIGFAEDRACLESLLPQSILCLIGDQFDVISTDTLYSGKADMIGKIGILLDKAKISYKGFGYNSASDIYTVNVEWGHTEHDHKFLNLMMKEVLGLYLVSEQYTTDKVDERYSSIHKYSVYC